MAVAEIVFIAIFGLGFLIGILGLFGVDTDFHFGHDVDFIRPVSISLGLVLGGFAAEATWVWVESLTFSLVALVVALVAGLFLGAVLDKKMKKSGGNSHFGRSFFQSQIGVVDMTISPSGWGMVNVVDKSGAATCQKARTNQDVALQKGEKVIVVDVADDYLTVEKSPFE